MASTSLIRCMYQGLELYHVALGYCHLSTKPRPVRQLPDRELFCTKIISRKAIDWNDYLESPQRRSRSRVKNGAICRGALTTTV